MSDGILKLPLLQHNNNHYYKKQQEETPNKRLSVSSSSSPRLQLQDTIHNLFYKEDTPNGDETPVYHVDFLWRQRPFKLHRTIRCSLWHNAALHLIDISHPLHIPFIVDRHVSHVSDITTLFILVRIDTFKFNADVVTYESDDDSPTS
jgi:hypothetical protein